MIPLLRTALPLLVVAGAVHAVDTRDTRLISDPAKGPKRIAFAYANDLWTAAPDGTDPRRLTSHPGAESSPRFSPDGRLITFTGQYDGNTDVYVVDADGGVPRRLTTHPGVDTVLGFTPDGQKILFASSRASHYGRHLHLYTMPVSGGWPTRLPIPYASDAAYSADGSVLAYVPNGPAHLQWKNYRGGTVSRVMLYDPRTHDVTAIPQPEGRCNDLNPVFIGNTLYFRSDRDGEFNLYTFDRATQAVKRLTDFKGLPVLGLAAGKDGLLLEQAGWLHTFDPATATLTRLKIGLAADLPELRSRTVSANRYVRDASLSPSGNRIALEVRGDILTVPLEKGDDRNLTRTPGAHERSPVWAPDGKRLAWFSDASGEYALHLGSPDGKGEAQRHVLKGAGFYEDLRWSPDGTRLSYTDCARALWILDAATGAQTKVDADTLYGPFKVLHHGWSPDGQWLTYTRNLPTQLNQVWLYHVSDGTRIPVSDGLADALHPTFDASGKYLWFLASTNAGPVRDWFAQSNTGLKATHGLYLAVLAKATPSPLARQQDEEGGKATTSKAESRPEAKADAKTDPKADSRPAVRIDAEDLSQRILAAPVKVGELGQLQAGAPGTVLYLRSEEDASALKRFDLETRKEDTLLAKAGQFWLSGDRKRVLVRNGSSFAVANMADRLDLSKYPLHLDRVRVKVDPQAEWPQIFHEAWRINRDYFYDPGFHGADWKAMREKYAAFLPHVATRNDLNRVMTWLFSELAVGHHRVGGGDSLAEGERVSGGLLGADFTQDQGRYRFQKVLGGLNWNPELRSPLTEPGVDVKAGAYLLAVEGTPLKAEDDVFARFEGTAGRTVELTVGPNPDGTGARTVKVVPVASEAALRNRDWIEGNLRRVTEATKGRVAYAYVPNTAAAGYESFKRYFYPQADREALIVDERYNGGGMVADYYIDLLRRPAICQWTLRYGQDLKTPASAIQGPKVMIADENAGSGGDLLPYMFKKLQLGPVVGQRTWGGLVGILGFPTLLDGGFVTAPNLAIWDEQGYSVENEGVAPDVEVALTPRDVLTGRDPQLEKAIELALKALPAQPAPAPKKPAFPRRAMK